MSEMVERVQLVLKNLLEPHRGATNEMVDAFFHHAARSVIMAMREPTDDMIRRGFEEGDNLGVVTEAEEVWQAMIDAALRG